MWRVIGMGPVLGAARRVEDELRARCRHFRAGWRSRGGVGLVVGRGWVPVRRGSSVKGGFRVVCVARTRV